MGPTPPPRAAGAVNENDALRNHISVSLCVCCILCLDWYLPAIVDRLSNWPSVRFPECAVCMLLELVATRSLVSD